MSRDKNEKFFAALRAASRHVEEALSETFSATALEARRTASKNLGRARPELGSYANPAIEEDNASGAGLPPQQGAKVIHLFGDT